MFCGQDMGIEILLRPENMAPLLPAPTDLSWQERIVLLATSACKSSYAGIKDARFHEASRQVGITRLEWDAALAACQERGLLARNKAITDAGRNAVSGRSAGSSLPKRP